MFYVYLLQSEIDQSFYIGQTNNIDKRLFEHNSGQMYFTKRKKPYKLLYYEAYATRKSAIEREHQLKKFGSAYSGLIKRITNK